MIVENGSEFINEFYVVVKDRHDLNAGKRHESYNEAIAEAQRLARLEKCRFYVLKAVALCEPAEIPIRTLNLPHPF